MQAADNGGAPAHAWMSVCASGRRTLEADKAPPPGRSGSGQVVLAAAAAVRTCWCVRGEGVRGAARRPKFMARNSCCPRPKALPGLPRRKGTRPRESALLG